MSMMLLKFMWRCHADVHMEYAVGFSGSLYGHRCTVTQSSTQGGQGFPPMGIIAFDTYRFTWLFAGNRLPLLLGYRRRRLWGSSFRFVQFLASAIETTLRD